MNDLLDWESMFDVGAAVKATKEAQAAKRAKYDRSEAKLQKDILAYLAKVGFLVIRINSSVQWTDHGSRLTAYRVVNSNATSGVADAIVMLNKRVYMCEIKTPKGRLSASQTAFRDLCVKYGIDYVILRSGKDAEVFAELALRTGGTDGTTA